MSTNNDQQPGFKFNPTAQEFVPNPGKTPIYASPPQEFNYAMGGMMFPSASANSPFHAHVNFVGGYVPHPAMLNNNPGTYIPFPQRAPGNKRYHPAPPPMPANIVTAFAPSSIVNAPKFEAPKKQPVKIENVAASPSFIPNKAPVEIPAAPLEIAPVVVEVKKPTEVLIKEIASPVKEQKKEEKHEIIKEITKEIKEEKKEEKKQEKKEETKEENAETSIPLDDSQVAIESKSAEVHSPIKEQKKEEKQEIIKEIVKEVKEEKKEEKKQEKKEETTWAALIKKEAKAQPVVPVKPTTAVQPQKQQVPTTVVTPVVTKQVSQDKKKESTTEQRKSENKTENKAENKRNNRDKKERNNKKEERKKKEVKEDKKEEKKEEKKDDTPQQPTWASRFRQNLPVVKPEIQKEVPKSIPQTNAPIIKKDEKKSENKTTKSQVSAPVSPVLTIAASPMMKAIQSPEKKSFKKDEIKTQIPEFILEKPLPSPEKVVKKEEIIEKPIEKITEETEKPIKKHIEEMIEKPSEKTEELTEKTTQEKLHKEDEDDRPPALSAQFVADKENAELTTLTYSLEMLLRFKTRQECQSAPVNHNIPSILLFNKNDPKSNNTYDRRSDRRTGHRNNNRSNRNRNNRQKDDTLNFDDSTPEAALVPSSNSWLCAVAKKEVDEREQTSRSMRSILNKLSLEKFDSLYNQLLQLNFSTENVIDLTKLIFEKAITQHHFIDMYAELCCHLSTQLKISDCTNEKFFKEQLITTLQENFENVNINGTNQYADLLAVNPNDEDILENYFKHKRKSLGNVRFVAALLTRKIVPMKIARVVIDQLFAKATEEHIEALVAFLTIIGKFESNEKEARNYKYAFEKLEQFASGDLKTTQRSVCLIKDLLDLRNRKWEKKSTAQDGPKTINEIRNDAIIEEKSRQLQSQKNAEMLKNQKNQKSNNNSRNNNTNVITYLSEKAAIDEGYSIVRNIASINDAKYAVDQFVVLKIESMHLVSVFENIFLKCLKTDKQRRNITFEFLAYLGIYSDKYATGIRKSIFEFLDKHFENEKEEFPKLGDVIVDDFLETFYDIDIDDRVFNRDEYSEIREKVGVKNLE